MKALAFIFLKALMVKIIDKIIIICNSLIYVSNVVGEVLIKVQLYLEKC